MKEKIKLVIKYLSVSLLIIVIMYVIYNIYSFRKLENNLDYKLRQVETMHEFDSIRSNYENNVYVDLSISRRNRLDKMFNDYKTPIQIKESLNIVNDLLEYLEKNK